MTDDSATRLTAELADAETLHSIEDLCLACQVDTDWIVELIEYGVIEPIGEVSADRRFSTLTLLRIAKAKRLERDLDLNAPGLAIVLDLLDEIDDLRRQIAKRPLSSS